MFLQQTWFRDSFNQSNRTRPVDSACYGSPLQRNKLPAILRVVRFFRSQALVRRYRFSYYLPYYLHRLNSYCALYVCRIWLGTILSRCTVTSVFSTSGISTVRNVFLTKKKAFAQRKLYHRPLYKILLQWIGRLKCLKSISLWPNTFILRCLLNYIGWHVSKSLFKGNFIWN